MGQEGNVTQNAGLFERYKLPSFLLGPIEEENEADLIEEELSNLSKQASNTIRNNRILTVSKSRLIKFPIKQTPTKITFRVAQEMTLLPSIFTSDDTSPTSASSKNSCPGYSCNSIEEIRKDRRIHNHTTTHSRSRHIIFSSAKGKQALMDNLSAVRPYTTSEHKDETAFLKTHLPKIRIIKSKNLNLESKRTVRIKTTVKPIVRIPLCLEDRRGKKIEGREAERSGLKLKRIRRSTMKEESKQNELSEEELVPLMDKLTIVNNKRLE